jgi:hypothetical protein
MRRDRLEVGKPSNEDARRGQAHDEMPIRQYRNSVYDRGETDDNAMNRRKAREDAALKQISFGGDL